MLWYQNKNLSLSLSLSLLKTEMSLRCLLAKATWWIKCNYSYNYIRDFETVFEIEYIWNGWVKKYRANVNLVLCN